MKGTKQEYVITPKQANKYLDDLLNWYRNKRLDRPQDIKQHNFEGRPGRYEIGRSMLYHKSAIQKLSDDGLIKKISLHEELEGEYEITFKGLCFEGYEVARRREQWNRGWRIATIIIACVAFVLSILNTIHDFTK